MYKMSDIVKTLEQEILAQKDAIMVQEIYLKAKQAYLKSLEEQLGVIKSKKLTDVGSQEDAFIQDPVELALQIPLILETILGNLDFGSLMTSRTVAKCWDKAALTVFSKTVTGGTLNLNNLFESSYFSPIPDLDAKLTKRITFEGSCECGSPSASECVCTNWSKEKILLFWQKHSKQIQEIDLAISSAFAPIFLKAITSCCPNLKTLYLKSYYHLENFQEPDLVEMESIPQEEEILRMNLNTIEFRAGCSYQESYYEPLQRIISRSPNLNRLKIEATFNPDLTNNKRLKYLCFVGGVNLPNFCQTKLSNALAQIKDSLEVLKLKTQDIRSPGPQGFRFPCMKMLKKLVVWDVGRHPLDQDGKTIFKTITSKFPNLEHLEIKSCNGKGVEVMLNKATKGRHMPRLKIKTLIVDEIQHPSVLHPLSLWFPNLKKLKLSMSEVEDIEILFSELKKLKLKHLSFSMQFRCNFSDLVRALDANQELYKDMEVLEIHANGGYDGRPSVEDDLEDEFIFRTGDECVSMRQVFCEWLQNTAKNMKAVSFYQFTFKGASASKVMSVIRENQLPVHFVNGNCD